MRSKVPAQVLAWSIAFFAVPVAAQPEEPRGSFRGTVDVGVVNIDVYVTDRAGQPITDLTLEDFTLLEGGRPVPISYFEATTISRRGTGPSAATEVAQEPLLLVVLLDHVNTRRSNHVRVVPQLKQVLAERLGPMDRVMVASYDRDIRVLLPFSSDLAALNRALDQLGEAENIGRELENETDMLGEFMEYALEGEMGRCHHVLEGFLSRYSGAVTHRVSTMVESVKAFLGTLASVPGRKSMLYVSDGLELRPGSALVRRLGGFCGDSAASIRAEGIDLALALQRLTSAANSARVTLYPYDAQGGRDAARRSRRGDSSQFEGRDSLQDSLAFLAADTGGRAMLNANDLASVIAPLWEDTSGYYSLGYEAPRRVGGALHRLEVKVRRKGAQARYRHGYEDASEESRLGSLLMSALWLGQADNPLTLAMEPGGGALTTDSGFRVPLRISVPIANLGLVEKDATHQGGFSVFVTAVDTKGLRAPLARAEVPVVIPATEYAAARSQHFGYEIGLFMNAGKQRVAIGIRDHQSQVISVITHEIEVGLPPSSEQPVTPAQEGRERGRT